MRYVKVDPITGSKVAEGTQPDDEPIVSPDHEGLLVFAIEGSPGEYVFDHATMSLTRSVDPIIELRRRLAEEKRPPTAEELAQLGITG